MENFKSKLRSVPARIFQIIILVLNAILIILAPVFLCYGIYQKQYLTERGTNLLEFTLTFVDFGIGVMGIVAVLLKKRGLLIASIILMSTSMLVAICLCVFHSVAMGALPALYKQTMSEHIAAYYGNNKEAASYSRAFTIYIDNRQRDKRCCGWSGIDGENAFLQSPWYTAVNKRNSSEKIPFTLPKSCCIKVSHECTQATDVKAARDSGAVYKHDCADLFSDLAARYHITMMIEYIFYVLLQAGSIMCQIIFLIHVVHMGPLA